MGTKEDIKDDILVHGIGREHYLHLRKVCETLQMNGITVRPTKCHLGQSPVKWFGQVYSKSGVSADPEKCPIIKEWPAPKSTSEVKSFLQTTQFNAKFMGGEAGEATYPELTAPLRALTKKYARFRWGNLEDTAFNELKKRLCSDKVLMQYDLTRMTRLYTPVQLEHRRRCVNSMMKITGGQLTTRKDLGLRRKKVTVKLKERAMESAPECT